LLLRLASAGSICHLSIMKGDRTPAAGGIFLFLGPVAGAAYGAFVSQPIMGMLIGFAAGLALAIIVWLIDRSRR
jgi:hypothetical protein